MWNRCLFHSDVEEKKCLCTAFDVFVSAARANPDFKQYIFVGHIPNEHEYTKRPYFSTNINICTFDDLGTIQGFLLFPNAA